MKLRLTLILIVISLLATVLPVAAQDGPGGPGDMPMDNGFDIAFSDIYVDSQTGLLYLTITNNDEMDIDFRLENDATLTSGADTDPARGFTVPAGESVVFEPATQGIQFSNTTDTDDLPAAVVFEITAIVGGPASIQQEFFTLAAPVLDEAPPQTPLLIRAAWARNTFPNSAGYMEIENTSDTDISLVALVSPEITAAELHESSMSDDDMMAMRPVDAIVLPAGERFILQPGGFHFMLIGVQPEIAVGDAFAVTLILDDETALTIALPVLDEAPFNFPGAGIDDDGMMDMNDMHGDEMEMGDDSGE